MFTNNKKNRLHILIIAIIVLALAMIAAFTTGTVSKMILIFYLLGIALLFLQQMLRLHELKNMIEQSRGKKK